MSFPFGVGTQVAAIMDVLTKAAVAEITKLVEEGALVLRLEVQRRDTEIQELRSSLKMMETELCEAQEAAARRAAEKEEEQTAAGSLLLGGKKLTCTSGWKDLSPNFIRKNKNFV